MVQAIETGRHVRGDERKALAANLRHEYESGTPIRSLAAQTGRSYGFVYTLLREAETPLRSRGGFHRGTP